jgi:acetyltransferase-like isoleucine patch superfamily enzyme
MLGHMSSCDRLPSRVRSGAGSRVWIGAAATIAPGVRIGRGSVIGAGAVIAKDVPELSVVTSAGHIERKRLQSPPTWP